MSASNVSLLEALLWQLLPQGGYVVTIYSAYLDESGTSDAENVLCVAGYRIRADKAVLMERDWIAALAVYDLPYFHSADCHADPGNGPFARLRKPERIAISIRTIELIKQYTEFGFAMVVNPKRHYEGLEAASGHIPDAYSWCLQNTTKALSMIGIEQTDEVTLFFEKGHKDSAKAHAYLESSELPPACKTYTFAEKGKIHLLEAADVLAWQCTKFIKDKAQTTRKPRKDFLSLMERKHYFGYVDIRPTGVAMAQDSNPKGEDPRRNALIKALFSKSAGDESQLADSYGGFRYRFDSATGKFVPR